MEVLLTVPRMNKQLPSNEIFARHCLATRQQKPGENLDEFLQALKILSKDCNFKDVTAARHQEETIRDAFISGLQSSIIRQRLKTEH